MESPFVSERVEFAGDEAAGFQAGHPPRDVAGLVVIDAEVRGGVGMGRLTGYW